MSPGDAATSSTQPISDDNAVEQQITLLIQENTRLQEELKDIKAQINNPAPQRPPAGEESTDEDRVINEILGEMPGATNFKVRQVLERFAGFRGYYVEFQAPDVEEADAFYYVLVSDKRCRLLDDGIAILEALQAELDKRRSFIQRIGEFQLGDVIGGTIAIVITAAFITMVATKRPLPPEFLAIFSVITGYFFGKNVPAAK